MNQLPLRTAQRQWYTILICMLVPISGVFIDIYVPSLPHMAQSLQANRTLVQLTVAVYSFGLGFGQFFVGPITDSFGRKKIMIIALITTSLLTLAILATTEIYTIIILRVLQGIAVALIVVPARAILGDLYSGNTFKKKMNLVTISWALGPILAPAIGGYLQHYFGWRACFYFMLGYALIALVLVCTAYKDTLQEPAPFALPVIAKNYLSLAKDRLLILNLIIAGVMAAFIVLFNIVAPFLVQTVLGHSAIVYGRVALLMGLAWFTGNSLNHRLHEVDSLKKLAIGFWLLLSGSVLLWVLSVTVSFSLAPLIIPSAGLIFLAALIFPNTIGDSLIRFPKIAGSANAFFFSGLWIVCALVTSFGALLKAHSMQPLAIAFTALSVICLLIFYGGLRRT